MNRKTIRFLMKTPMKFLVRFYLGQDDWHWPHQTLYIIEKGKGRFEKWAWHKDYNYDIFFKLRGEIPDKYLYMVIKSCAKLVHTSDTYEEIRS